MITRHSEGLREWHVLVADVGRSSSARSSFRGCTRFFRAHQSGSSVRGGGGQHLDTCAEKSGGLALPTRHLRNSPKKTRGSGEFFGSRSPYSHTDQRRMARSHA